MLAGGVHFHLGAFKLVQLLADGSLQGIVGKQNSVRATGTGDAYYVVII